MSTAVKQRIEDERDERREFAAACWRIAERDRENGDVRSVEASARTAEREAARLDALVSP
jgi:hypothetical protein